MNQITDDVLLAKSGYEYSPYISFKNPHLKKVHESLEKAFLSGNSLPEMITNGFLGLLNYPLDLLNEYFKHLDEQKAEKAKALNTARGKWDDEQLKAQGLTTSDVFSLLAQTVQASQASVPDMLQKRYPDFYNTLPKDKDNNILPMQLTKKQKDFIAQVSEGIIMDDFNRCLNQTFGRKLAPNEIKNYQNAIEKMNQSLKDSAKQSIFMDSAVRDQIRQKISLKEAGKKAPTTRGQKKDLTVEFDTFEKKQLNVKTRFQKVRDFGQRLFQAKTQTGERQMPQQTRSDQNVR